MTVSLLAKVFAVAALLSIFTFSQTQADFNKEFNQGLNQYKEKQDKEFKEYLEEQDKEFIKFLKTTWGKYELTPTKKPDEKPKPKAIPKVKVVPKKLTAPIKDETRVEPKELKPLPAPPAQVEAPKTPEGLTNTSIDYFGSRLAIAYDGGLKNIGQFKASAEDIARFWLVAASTNHRPIMEQMAYYFKELNLGHWGLYQLSDKIATEIYPDQGNTHTLMVWFLLSKAGFPSRVAFGPAGKVLLFLPLKQHVYQSSFFTMEGVRYYNISVSQRGKAAGQIQTYKAKYPTQYPNLDLQIRQWPGLKPNPEQKALTFPYAGKMYTIKVNNDLNIIDFARDYPQVELNNYLNAPVQDQVSHQLQSQLRQIIAGKTEREAVNILLAFLHFAFNYKTDDQQFGYEKFLFSEETLHYPASDCEDRSILFAHLVRTLTGLAVVGVDYPGHVATAVRFKGVYPGDGVMYKGINYLICDATYIGAVAGMEQPPMKGKTRKVVEIEPGLQ